MSNCYSSQAEYDDHDFIEWICKDCGEVSKRDVTALAGQVKMLESKVTELTESNRRLANQIAGYGDRMQQTIAGIVKDAKVEALREAADLLDEESPFHNIIDTEAHWAIGSKWAARLRTRADNLEAP